MRSTDGLTRARGVATFLSGLGMILFSVLTIRHFFEANYPATIFEGSICDLNEFFNCDSSAFSIISELWGVPLGYFGLVMGILVSLGALFPSEDLRRTNHAASLLNAVGVLGLFFFSVLYLGSLCLLCSGYYLFSLISFGIFWRSSTSGGNRSFAARFLRPSIKRLLTIAVIALAGAYGFALYHEALKEAQVGGVSARIVQQFRDLPEGEWPSYISPYFTVQSTERFEDAPIQVVEYADLLCPDCRYLNDQMQRIKREFAGKINVAFQFFPLEARCNDVVAKDKHPGACDLAYMAAFDPDKFLTIHDEVFEHLREARDPEWRQELARKYRVEEALDDPQTRDRVHRIIQTGTEYEKTSDQYAHGVRSTPTMIINRKMIIGTLPYQHLRAIFRSILEDEGAQEDPRFIENWVETP